MDNIKWGPEREGTGDQPCPDWVPVRMYIERRHWSDPLPAKNLDWTSVLRYHLPAEYEALLDAKEPTHEQMLETLAARYEGIPDALVEIDPVKAAYQASGKVHGCAWQHLDGEFQEAFRAAFKAGQEHSQKHSN